MMVGDGIGISASEWGARIIYILRSEGFPIFLVQVYRKNERDNLTQHERNGLAKLSDSIFTKYIR
jgi:hypothetical protein